MGFKYNATGVNPDMKPVPAPQGNYMLVIRDANDLDKQGNPRKSKNGDPMVNVRCEIDDANEWLGTTVWHNVTFLPRSKNGAGMAVKFLKALGEPFEGECEVNPANWVEKRFKAHLKVEKDFHGDDRNQIAYVIMEDNAVSSENGHTEVDEVPF